MHRILLIIRGLLAAVQDVLHGSVLLARGIRSGSRRLREKVRTRPDSLPGPGKRKAKASGKHEKPADATAGDPVTKNTAADDALAKTDGNTVDDKKSTPRKPKPWTLDRVAGTAFLGWAAWCFGRQAAVHSWHVAAPYAAMLWPWALLGWMVAALCAAQDHKRRQGTGQPLGAEAVKAGSPDGEEVLRAERWFRHLVISRVAEAVARGRKGIHLRSLLQEPGIPESWDVTIVRQHCERVGIPHRPMTIRGEGTGPTHGVHVDDLTHALGMPIEQALARYDSDGSSTSAEAPSEALLEGSSGAPSPAQSGGPLAWLFGARPRRPTNPAHTPRSAPLPTPSPAPPERG
ncbi:hypothetical protein [Streptomyces sp. NPDC046978]|uniref:hypothetical protein n=1 Tax=Streptomyces sp. NPDC046978 TaxID=3154704 RepID=UPI0033D745BC